MNLWLSLIVLVLVLGVVFWTAAFHLGRRRGAKEERQRCVWLVLKALDQRWSPSLRWVLHAINGNHDLAPMDQFIDVEDTERKQKAKDIVDLMRARDESDKEERQRYVDKLRELVG